MTVCVGFLDRDKNGILMADSSKWFINGDYYGKGYLKIKQIELIKISGEFNFAKPEKRSIGVGFAGDSDVIDYIIVAINEPIFIDDFDISKSLNVIGNLFHKRLKEKFEVLINRVDLVIMGYCDIENKIVAFKAKLNPSEKFEGDWEHDEYLKPGKGPALIGATLENNYFECKTLECMYDCIIKRRGRSYQIEEPIKYGIVSTESKNFEYIGDYIRQSCIDLEG